jgi:hypothetical protein
VIGAAGLIRTLCPELIPTSPDKMSLHFKTDCLIGEGMTHLPSFQSIIDLWPSREAMAAEIGAKPAAVSKWWQRDSVPAEWWSTILATERAVGAGLNAEALTALAARQPAVDEARA